MPKQKTHSGYKKRLKITGTGKVRRHHAYTGHLKQNKTHKQNKHLSQETNLDKTDYKRIKSVISNLK